MKRQRGLGSTFKHHAGSDVWWIQYSVHGKRHRESSGSTDHAVATRMLRQKIADVVGGKPVGPKLDRTTLADLLALVEARYKADGRRSAVRVRIAGGHLTRILGAGCRARDIDNAAITSYQAKRLEEGAAAGTVNIETAALRRGVGLALDAGRLAMQPRFKQLKLSNTRSGFFEVDQFRAVLRHLPEYLIPFCRVAYITGWRRGELTSRMWKHVDFAKGLLRLDPGETKNGEGREFPFTPELRAILEAQRERVGEISKVTGRIVPWVFCQDSGAPLYDFRRAWATACRKAGVPGRLVHDFRRTAVRNLERAGVPRSSAMKLTGHRSESVYRRYAIVDSGMLQEAVAKLAALHTAEK
jgi:integrase